MRFRLLKDTPELLSGAIVMEECNDGTQGFECLSKTFIKDPSQKKVRYSRGCVIGNTEWFEEVGLVYLTKVQLNKLVEFLTK